LSPLPDLSQSDLYLLYSLMLHGDLTIKSLANSLGDAPQVVTNQVQMLRSADVIEQKDSVIKTNPVHYPNLRRELAKNNFIIEVPQ
ncbi:MAG: ArsR family transcriptional regulator, partial [Cyanobacteria bacterium J06555_13]